VLENGSEEKSILKSKFYVLGFFKFPVLFSTLLYLISYMTFFMVYVLNGA